MKKTAFSPHDNCYVNYFSSCQKHDMPVQHYHDSYEIYLQLSGRRYLFFDNTCYTLETGSLAVFCPFELHCAESRDIASYSRCVVNFRLDFLHLLLSREECMLLSGKLSSCVMQLSENQTKKLSILFQNLCEAHEQTGFLADKLSAAVLLQIILFVIKCTEKTDIMKGQTAAPEIIVALEYIQKHYKETLSLEQLASAVHLSKYYFCRCFHNATGVPVFEYLNHFRLAKVSHLLLYSDMSIDEIAEETGFSSAASLTRVFKKSHAVTPREFRKKGREQISPNQAISARFCPVQRNSAVDFQSDDSYTIK